MIVLLGDTYMGEAGITADKTQDTGDVEYISHRT